MATKKFHNIRLDTLDVGQQKGNSFEKILQCVIISELFGQ